MRTSPSGPGTLNDRNYLVAQIDPALQPPGDYFIVPLALAASLGTSLVPVADPGAATILLVSGPETRAGKMGKTRIFLAPDVSTAGSDPIVFQWNVNGVLVGPAVVVPWEIPNPLPTTIAEYYSVLAGRSYDMPGVVWAAGDIPLLQVTLGSLVGLATSIFGFATEKSYP